MKAVRIVKILFINLKLCMVEIFTNKTRSVLSSLGIFLGTASLLVNMTFLRAMKSMVMEDMARMGGITVMKINKVEPQTAEEVLEFQRSEGLKYTELVELEKLIPGIETIMPEEDLHWKYLSVGGKGIGCRINAVVPEYHTVYDFNVAVGRHFTRQDYDQRSRVCIIGNQVANQLFGDSTKALGKRISFDANNYEIIGVFTTKDKNDRRGRECHILYSVYLSTYGGLYKRPDEVAIKVRSVDDIRAVKLAIETHLLRMHRGIRDFAVEANEDKIKEMENASLGITVVIGSIAFISLCVGSISIMNIMFGTIGDRIREIGIHKALGAKKIDVFLQFLTEAVLLSFVGGLPGMVLGSTLTLFPEGTFPFTPELSVIDFVIATLFIFFAGVGSGLFPALKAADMEPIEALQY